MRMARPHALTCTSGTSPQRWGAHKKHVPETVLIPPGPGSVGVGTDRAELRARRQAQRSGATQGTSQLEVP